MYSIIRDFALGNINPNERGYKRSKDFEKAAKELMEAENRLLATLNEDEKKMYEQLTNAQITLSAMAEAEKFEQGYILGSYFSFEVMSRIDEIIQ